MIFVLGQLPFVEFEFVVFEEPLELVLRLFRRPERNDFTLDRRELWERQEELVVDEILARFVNI